MSRMYLLFTFLCLFPAFAVSKPVSLSEGTDMLVRIHYADAGSLQTLADAYDIAHVAPNHVLAVVSSPEVLGRLQKSGVPFEVVEPDMRKVFQSIYKHKDLGAYYTYDEVQVHLQQAVNTSPDLVQFFSIGKSLEGRDRLSGFQPPPQKVLMVLLSGRHVFSCSVVYMRGNGLEPR